MKTIIAMDSFKGCLSSLDAGNTIKEAILSRYPSDSVEVFPLADGGEGTVDVLTAGLGGDIVPVTVTGPLGQPVASRYGWLPKSHTAIIEMADASGLPLVPPAFRNPMNTTTYGLGELISAALSRGCRHFIIGIGGSATNDAGIGMLTALGYHSIRKMAAVSKATAVIWRRSCASMTARYLRSFGNAASTSPVM